MPILPKHDDDSKKEKWRDRGEEMQIMAESGKF